MIEEKSPSNQFPASESSSDRSAAELSRADQPLVDRSAAEPSPAGQPLPGQVPPGQYSDKVTLEGLWLDQLQKRQFECNKIYAKRHSLEMSLGQKIFHASGYDRSNDRSGRSSDESAAA